MINMLLAGKSANFYGIQTKITKRAIVELFRSVRAAQVAPSRNYFFEVKQRSGQADWSAVCFSYKRSPPFLREAAGVQEKVYGFLMLVEYSGYLAVFKSQLDLPSGFIAAHLSRIGAERINAGLTTDVSTFERIRLRNLTISKHALRVKTLEAENLENSIGPASSSRFAPVGYHVVTNGEHFSATPRTGRIAQRSDCVDFQGLNDYACNVLDRITNRAGGRPAAFLHTFAQSIELSSTPARPTQIAIDVAGLRTAILDDREFRFVREEGGTWAEMTGAEVETALNELDDAFLVTGTGRRMDISRSQNHQNVGTIAVNKNRIALRSLVIPRLLPIFVERTTNLTGHNDERISLREFIDQGDAFIVLFDRPELAYINGALYRDEGMTSGGGPFLRHLFGVASLDTVTNEKGPFLVGQSAFDQASTFGVVVQDVSADDDVLVCDDLGDEWADFIGLRTDPDQPRVTFYHAKHGPLSLGASPFHISISQAIKNLGRLGLTAGNIAHKLARWNETYNNANVQTSISRTCRGHPRDLEAAFATCRETPHATKRVAIVTSSLSRAAVVDAFGEVQANGRAEPHFVQLYWLLSSFFSACAEVGAFGYVVCRP